MIVKNLAITALSLLFLACQTKMTSENHSKGFKPLSIENKALTYPDTYRDESVKDNYHGNTIRDAYRWLEDDNSAETKQWVDEENTLTFNYLDGIKFRPQLRTRLEELYNYTKYSIPF